MLQAKYDLCPNDNETSILTYLYDHNIMNKPSTAIILYYGITIQISITGRGRI